MHKYIYILLLITLAGCSTNITPEAIETETQKTKQTSSEEKIDTESVQVIDEQEEIGEETVYDEISLPTLMNEEINGYDLKLEKVLNVSSNYTRYRISYKNGDLNLSGIMNIPKGEGPFPLLILNHGYIDINYYTNGRGLKREQDYFANNGYAVIHPDYRNHAMSDKVSETPYDFRLGYTRDVLASIVAAQNSELPELESVDTSRVGMLGHSMGSGVAQNIAVSSPEIAQAFVLYGPVSNDEYINFEHFQMDNAQRSSRVEQVISEYKTRQENPAFWNGVSSKTFIENISSPVMIFTGTNDADTPTAWAQNIAQNLSDAGKQVEIVSYPEEGHEFSSKWSDFMNQSKIFFDENI